jgi:ribosome biogenesis protein Tsr3
MGRQRITEQLDQRRHRKLSFLLMLPNPLNTGTLNQLQNFFRIFILFL